MNSLQRPLALVLSLLLALMPVVPVQAALLGNSELLTRDTPTQTRDSLQRLLGREDAQQQLQQLGISAEWARERVQQLSDSELARINQGIAAQDAGGDVLGVIVLIFIVFIITDAIGATDIFPFVHPVR